MGKRAEEANERRILQAVELLTGQKFTEDMLTQAAKGSDEQDFVNSGLEDTMVVAYQRLREIWKGDSRIPDLRTAAFLDAIEKVARAYGELGIFP
jgi:glutamate dehydrogenase (NAD(P)+)